MIIPSIDIMGGKAVQLRQGKEHVLTSEKDPLELAKVFNRYGEVAVIDLDAALGKGNNRNLVKELCAVADVRAGGGVRDVETARELLRAGAKKVIIGTAATEELLSKLPTDRVMVALDQVDGTVVDNGWRTSTGESVLDRAKRLSPFCSGFLSTFVKSEGCMVGVDQNAVITLRDELKRPLTVAGGVAKTSDAVALTGLGVDVQVGMALYTGQLNLNEAIVDSLKWDASGLIPTVVQDAFGNILMVAYSSKESLTEALSTGKGVYFSRSRQSIWRKGETSGNPQQLISCRSDCDNDTIIFLVDQTGVACHNGSYTCFTRDTARTFDLEKLFQVIASRKAGDSDEKSYTQKLLDNPTLLKKKIMEEAFEVVSFTSQENLKWEIADLLYFVSVLATQEGVSWREIENELGGRAK
ncbi:MAG: bifunctional phosphoribosyl-AMP cyclohydrolase/phosphoribosyl-ATP diphosphatase HisIE [Candidatus Melainabacteria bacterium]|nr:bifunctional phosphoribosyl-AMP cyclohydrolase/phosphoribosyl-ATP diphosphatase HisIE [Candidatus Melainabacteria bacterium]